MCDSFRSHLDHHLCPGRNSHERLLSLNFASGEPIGEGHNLAQARRRLG
jgi:hypothetical protein